MGADTELICIECNEVIDCDKDWMNTERIEWFLRRHVGHAITPVSEYEQCPESIELALDAAAEQRDKADAEIRDWDEI